MKKIVLMILAVLTAISLLSQVTEINITSEEWDGATNADGTGLYWDLVKLVFEPAGVKVNISSAPYARGVHEVEAGSKDAWVGAYADEEDFAVFPEHHFDTDKVSACFIKGKCPGWQGISSLKDKRLAWMRGYGYDEYFDFKPEFQEIDNRVSGLKMLKNNRFDVLIDASVEIGDALNKNPELKGEVEIKELLKLKLFVAFVGTDRGKELLKIWDTRMAELIKSGELKKLYEKSGYTQYPY